MLVVVSARGGHKPYVSALLGLPEAQQERLI